MQTQEQLFRPGRHLSHFNADALMAKRMRNLDCQLDISMSPGNYDYDQYMYGLTNGLALAKSTLTDSEPVFAPPVETWLKDIPATGNPTAVSDAESGE